MEWACIVCSGRGFTELEGKRKPCPSCVAGAAMQELLVKLQIANEEGGRLMKENEEMKSKTNAQRVVAQCFQCGRQGPMALERIQECGSLCAECLL